MERAVVRLVAAALGTDLPGRAREDAPARLHLRADRVRVPGPASWSSGSGISSPRTSSTRRRSPSVTGLRRRVWVVAAAFQSLFAESFRAFQRFWLATLFNGLLFDVVARGRLRLAVPLQHRHSAVAHAILLDGRRHHCHVVIAAVILGRSVRGAARPRRHPRSASCWTWRGRSWASTSPRSWWARGSTSGWWARWRASGTSRCTGRPSKLVFYVATAFIIASQVVPPIIAELWAQGKKQQLEQALREMATLAGRAGRAGAAAVRGRRAVGHAGRVRPGVLPGGRHGARHALHRAAGGGGDRQLGDRPADDRVPANDVLPDVLHAAPAAWPPRSCSGACTG